MYKRIEFIYASCRKYAAGDLLIPHDHEAHALHYIAEGEGTFRIGEKTYNVKPGDCFLVFAGQIHELLPVKQAVTVISVRMHFIDPLFTFASDETPFLNMPYWKPYLEHIYRNRASSDSEYIRNSEDILSTILLRFKMEDLTYTRDRSVMIHSEQYTKPTRKVIVYIEGRINKKINFDEMARKLFYNKSYLCEIFKAETGITINEYINFFRIRSAFDLFVFNNLSIKDVLQATGFSSTSYFSRVFKKYTDITPGEFQKLLTLVSEDERKTFFTESKLLKFQATTLDTIMQNFEQFKLGILELKKRYLQEKPPV